MLSITKWFMGTDTGEQKPGPEPHRGSSRGAQGCKHRNPRQDRSAEASARSPFSDTKGGTGLRYWGGACFRLFVFEGNTALAVPAPSTCPFRFCHPQSWAHDAWCKCKCKHDREVWCKRALKDCDEEFPMPNYYFSNCRLTKWVFVILF